MTSGSRFVLLGVLVVGVGAFNAMDAGGGAALISAAAVAASSTEDVPPLASRSGRSGEDTLSPPADWEDDGKVLDVLVVYTKRAEAEFASRGQSIEASLARAAAQADSAFRNSGIDLRVNIVHHQRVGYKESRWPWESGDLKRMRGRAGREIRELRRLHRADQVTLIRSSSGGTNAAIVLKSIATTPENIESWYRVAYSVIKSTCVDQSYRCFVHELGHILGAGHEAEMEAPGLYDDSYGYHYPEKITEESPCVFGTMQDYTCADDLRILFFSNPNRTFQGRPTGIAGVADNARAINAAKLFVANYEQSSQRGVP